MSPFCEYKLDNELWTCSKCGNTISLSQSAKKPITSCRIGYEEVGLKDFRVLHFINTDSYNLNTVSVTETKGVGTELKNLLRKFNLLPGLTYEYNQKFMMMNTWNVKVCETIKKDLIIQWLTEAAIECKIPYTHKHIHTLFKKAISNYKKKC